MGYKLQKQNVVKTVATEERARRLLEADFEIIEDDEKKPLLKAEKKEKAGAGGAK